MSKMMRISQATQENLDLLVKLVGKSKQAIIERAIEEYVREAFLKKTSEEYAQIKANPELWAKEIEEQEEWEATLRDEFDDLKE